MDARTDYRGTFFERFQSLRNQRSHRSKDDGGIQLLRGKFVGSPGPDGTRIFCKLLAFGVPRTGEGVDAASLIIGNLGENMSGGTKSVESYFLRIAGFAQRPVSD